MRGADAGRCEVLTLVGARGLTRVGANGTARGVTVSNSCSAFMHRLVFTIGFDRDLRMWRFTALKDGAAPRIRSFAVAPSFL